MKKVLLILCSLFVATALFAATYTPDNLPIPYLKDKTQYVSNPDGILSQTAVDSLNLWLGQMEKSHGVQTVLAVVEHIEGGDTYDFSMALGRKYGIGRKDQNSGLIILLSTGDRAYTILNVYDEGRLPLYHFDWYRVEDPEELYEIGAQEYLPGSGVTLVEWAERAEDLLPEKRTEVFIQPVAESARLILVSPCRFSAGNLLLGDIKNPD